MQEFQEYPKWLPIGDGVVVWSKEEEASKREITEEKPKRGRPRKEVTNGDQ